MTKTFAGPSNINIAGITAMIKDLGIVVGSYRTGMTVKNVMGTIRLNIFLILITDNPKMFVSYIISNLLIKKWPLQ